VEVVRSALEHGIDAADIEHAWTNAVRLVGYKYDGEDRLLVIGLANTAECWNWSRCLPISPRASSTPTRSDRSSSTT
jgi:hypothetical protein